MRNRFKTDKSKKVNAEMESFFLRPCAEKSKIEAVLSNRIVFTEHSRDNREKFVEKFNELERAR
ncbi:MAG: hypothetical protein J6K39_02570 [Clostridia bacterium]|nr:hypothetical protein [Clostridia bacterium]